MYTDNTNINIKIASLFPLQNQTTISCLNYEQVKTSFYGDGLTEVHKESAIKKLTRNS